MKDKDERKERKRKQTAPHTGAGSDRWEAEAALLCQRIEKAENEAPVWAPVAL